MCSLVHIGKENTGLLTLKRNHLTRKTTRKPLPPLEFDECYSHHFLDMIMQNKKMHQANTATLGLITRPIRK
jgi:hypothetical protein